MIKVPSASHRLRLEFNEAVPHDPLAAAAAAVGMAMGVGAGKAAEHAYEVVGSQRGCLYGGEYF